MSNNKVTAKELKGILWGTLKKLESNEIDVPTADAIAQQSREIVRVIKSQQSILTQAKENVTDELINYAK